MNQPDDRVNLLQHGDVPGESERVVEILRHAGVRIERIVSRGHASPEGFWYDQEDDEWVAVLAGSAALRFEGDATPVVLHAGDHLEIPAHRRHRVEWTAADRDTVWLAVFF